VLQYYRREAKTTHHSHAARPRAFKQNNVTPDNLPVTWKHNKKALMTMADFEYWLNELNETTKKKKRRVILCVDNSTSRVVYKKTDQCSCQVLAPYLTSELLTLDQGIIQAIQKVYTIQLAGCHRKV
jgi:hypothetical protein